VRVMRLNELRERILSNKKWIVISAVVLAVLLVLSFGIGERIVLSIPKIPSFVLTFETGGVGVLDLTNLPSAKFPETITTFRVEASDISLSAEEARAMAANFGFVDEPKEAEIPGGRVLTFIQDGKSLQVTTKPRGLLYTSEEDMQDDDRLVFDEVTAVTRAKDFLSTRGLPISDLSSTSVKYLLSLGGQSAVAQDRTSANFVEVIFSRSTGGFDVLGEAPTDGAASSIFNAAGEVVYLSFEFANFTLTQSDEVELKTVNEAVEDLLTSGEVVSVRPLEGVESWTLREENFLSSFAPESVRLAYVKLENVNILYPVFLFEGPGRMSNTNVQASVYLPAVLDKHVLD